MNIICLDKKLMYIQENNINKNIKKDKNINTLYKSISTQTSHQKLIESIYKEEDYEIPYESYERLALNLIQEN